MLIWKGFGLRFYPEIYMGWGNPLKSSARITHVTPGIRTEPLLNTSLKWYLYTSRLNITFLRLRNSPKLFIPARYFNENILYAFLSDSTSPTCSTLLTNLDFRRFWNWKRCFMWNIHSGRRSVLFRIYVCYSAQKASLPFIPPHAVRVLRRLHRIREQTQKYLKHCDLIGGEQRILRA